MGRSGRHLDVKRPLCKTEICKKHYCNHLNSAILLYEGIYDPATKTITFDAELEPVPGMKTKDHFLFKFLDHDHYEG